MVHIKDGMLAITSDAILFMLKFNYNKIHQVDGFKTFGNG